MSSLDKIIIVLVVALLAGGGVVGFCAWYFQPKLAVEREMETLTRDYYENYYYDEIMNNGGGVKALEEMVDYGLPSVKLRKLLLFDNQRHAESAAVFDSKHYKCDTNTTWAKIFPYAPYGRTDYRVEYTYGCEKV